MKIQFQKMHGTLNDFVVFADMDNSVVLSETSVARLCDRRAGIGADGLIVVRPSAVAHFFMDYYNADGSIAEMCGNGIRCLAKYVYDNGLLKEKEQHIETRAGIKTVTVEVGEDGQAQSVQVAMGVPIFDAPEIPVLVSIENEPVLNYPLEVRDRVFSSSFVSMGNPHCVIYLDEEIASLPSLYGPAIERHPLFPQKTNVEFVRVVSSGRLSMRVWERGSGETLSCGTGACAAAVIGMLQHVVKSPVAVDLLGGTLQIQWNGPGSSVLMSGPATLVYEGSITL
ncbi:MAG: diaminopimelate epimerase [Desulfomonilaceae bacterium]